MNILRDFSGIKAIFLPVLISCEFATEKCIANCIPVQHQKTEGNDEDAIDSFLFIFSSKPETIAAYIVTCLSSCKFLYWFATGDCPLSKTEHILRIMEILKECGIIQIGFTRNRKLWKLAGRSGTRLVLTIEDKSEIKAFEKTDGLLFIPDYKTGKGEMYSLREQKVVRSCGSDYSVYDMVGTDKRDNCMECFSNKIGCFTDFLNCK